MTSSARWGQEADFPPQALPSPLLSLRELSVDYLTSGRPAHALEEVSFDIHPGQTLGLVGESGCGKTTALMAVMRLLPAAGRITHGQALFEGRDGQVVDLFALSEADMRAYRWKEIAIVFQSAMNALNPVMSVGRQIGEAILLHERGENGRPVERREVERRVEELLDLVGIARSRKDQYPHQYSGGMRQRAMIAMALACRPRLLFADEPTTALDVMIQAQVLELLKRIQAELGLAIALVTHDLGVIAEICDSVVVMYGGKVAEYGPIEVVYNAPQHPYTQRLLEAFPDLNRPISTGEEAPLLATIPGAPPALDSLPPGCRFEPRCQIPEALRLQAGCRQASPPLVDVTAFSAKMMPLPESPGMAASIFLRQHFSACYFAGWRMDELEGIR